MNEVELLEHYRPWLRKVAAGMTLPDRAEDLAQEGWIALWKATQSYDGSAPLDWWLKRKAHGRMLVVIRNWGSIRNAQHRVVDFDFIESLGDELESAWLIQAISLELPEVELAYHHGEIVAALDALTPREREYVVARFWGGLNHPELTAHFGYQPQGLWRTARRKLVAQLEHLAVSV